MPVNEEKLNRLKRLFEIADDGLNKEEFLKAFKILKTHIINTEKQILAKVDFKAGEEKQKLETLRQEFQKEFSQIIQRVEQQGDVSLKGFRARTNEAINNIFASNEVKKKLLELVDLTDEKIREIDDRLSQVRDGQDADEKKIVAEVLNKIPKVERVDEEKVIEEVLKRVPKGRGGATRGDNWHTGNLETMQTMSVGSTEPPRPNLNDLWIDTS